MYDHLEPDNRNLDNLLAGFTDQILATDTPESELTYSQNPELHKLEETVLLLKRAIQETEPSQVYSNQIHNNLIAEWERFNTHPGEETPFQSTPFQNLLYRFRPRPSPKVRRNLTLGFAILTIVSLIIVLLLVPDINASVTATAGQGEGWLPVILVLGFLVVIAIYKFLRPRQ